MKKYQINLYGNEITILQDDDGKFFTPDFIKEKNKFGSCLKPAFEPIIIARKPFKGSLIDNVLQYRVGGMNIDECRVKNTSADTYDLEKRQISKATGSDDDGHFLDQLHNLDAKHGVTEQGRFPANVILTYDETDFNEVCGGFPNKDNPNGSITKKYKINNQVYGDYGYCNTYEAYQDSGSAARYFYYAKASKKDRDEGLDEFQIRQKVFNGKSDTPSEDMKDVEKRFTTLGRNIHPCVKPTELMQYIIRLVTPKNGTVLDPFMGSGSTGKAAMYENKNYYFIGVEMTQEYLPIAKARIDYAINNKEITLF